MILYTVTLDLMSAYITCVYFSWQDPGNTQIPSRIPARTHGGNFFRHENFQQEPGLLTQDPCGILVPIFVGGFEKTRISACPLGQAAVKFCLPKQCMLVYVYLA